MFLYAAATRRRLGGLVGGDEGGRLVEQADAWMTEQGIYNPTRMTALYAPGFPNDSARSPISDASLTG